VCCKVMTLAKEVMTVVEEWREKWIVDVGCYYLRTLLDRGDQIQSAICVEVVICDEFLGQKAVRRKKKFFIFIIFIIFIFILKVHTFKTKEDINQFL
jgi:hypothetical protein